MKYKRVRPLKRLLFKKTQWIEVAETWLDSLIFLTVLREYMTIAFFNFI